MNWDEILKRHGPAAWQVAYRILGNRSDADECYQEAMLNAVRLSRNEPVYNWSALLKRLASARAIDRLRQRYRHDKDHEEGRPVETISANESSPSSSMEMEELQCQLRHCLTLISTEQAQVFCLCCLEEWSYQEASEQLGITSQAVGVLLHRARSRLKELLLSHTSYAEKYAQPHNIKESQS